MSKEQIAVELTKTFFRNRGGIYTTEEIVKTYFEILSVLQGLYDKKIIEEDNNKIEKLEYHNSIPIKEDIKDHKMFIREILQNENILLDKINEIIDRLNKED